MLFLRRLLPGSTSSSVCWDSPFFQHFAAALWNSSPSRDDSSFFETSSTQQRVICRVSIRIIYHVVALYLLTITLLRWRTNPTDNAPRRHANTHSIYPSSPSLQLSLLLLPRKYFPTANAIQNRPLARFPDWSRYLLFFFFLCLAVGRSASTTREALWLLQRWFVAGAARVFFGAASGGDRGSCCPGSSSARTPTSCFRCRLRLCRGLGRFCKETTLFDSSSAREVAKVGCAITAVRIDDSPPSQKRRSAAARSRPKPQNHKLANGLCSFPVFSG